MYSEKSTCKNSKYIHEREPWTCIVKSKFQFSLKTVQNSWSQFSTGSNFNVSRLSMFRNIFFKLLTNDPGYKIHDFLVSIFNDVLKWPPGQYSTLKNDTRVNFQPGSIFQKSISFFSSNLQDGRTSPSLNMSTLPATPLRKEHI